VGAGGSQAGHRPLLDESRLVLGHQREDAEDELAVRGGGLDDPAGRRLHAASAGFEGGDDLDEITEDAPEPVDLPDDEGVTGAQVGQAFVPFGPGRGRSSPVRRVHPCRLPGRHR
jgi:hypothetical protein